MVNTRRQTLPFLRNREHRSASLSSDFVFRLKLIVKLMNMPTSDSEDFESADEGSADCFTGKKGRKNRLSSSNYSGSTQGSDHEPSKLPPSSQIVTVKAIVPATETSDGWDDFDVDDNESEEPKTISTRKDSKSDLKEQDRGSNIVKEGAKSKDTGWDDFDDWEQDDAINNQQQKKLEEDHQSASPDIKFVADRLAAATTKEPSGSAWGWGWGVDSLLSSATAGISSLTTQVSQGISTVLETGIGAPDPEELARKSVARDNEPLPTGNDKSSRENKAMINSDVKGDGDTFPFGSLISGVTKFVESTGTKVIAGGLDTLETIGKKTMEVLQDGDPGLVKKRAMLGLDPGDKPVLSQVLKEAKARADEEDRLREEKREAKEVHYESLFDDFEGLVHLEALEMLSKQVNMRIEERMRSVDSEKRQEIKETLQQVSELCEMPDEDDDEDTEAATTADGFHERLQEATQDLGLKLHLQPLVDQFAETLSWLSTAEANERAVYKRAVASLAQYTALSVEIYHKTGEMLLVKPRRSTADEADALTQMTVVLTRQISELATRFTEKLNSLPSDNKVQINTYITNVFLEAGNSSTYIQNAFQLALPILQIGAV